MNGPRHVSASNDVQEQTDRVATDPEVKQWIKRFRRCIRDMPKQLKLHAYEDTLTVQALLPDGSEFECTDGYIDQKASIETVKVATMSVGEW